MKLKKVISRQVQKNIMISPYYEINKIIKKLDTYEYISFDIFNTLLKRNVKMPIDVFRLMSTAFFNETGNEIDDFQIKRINAERITRTKSNNEEITLNDIYSNIDGYSEEELQFLKNLECKLEVDLSYLNTDMHNIFEYCLKENKKIILISDMYLPNKIIKKLLDKNGIVGYTRIYLSSELGLTKRSGHLFNYVLNDLKIKPSSIIHIGDSLISDYIIPRSKKIDAILIPEYTRKTQFDGIVSDEDTLNYNCLKAFTNNHIIKEKTEYYKFGYEVFGILLYGFCKWMIQDMKIKGINKVFFFSRDGYIIKQAFDLMNIDGTLVSYYLYVSRRSLRVPQIWLSPRYDDLINYLPLCTVMTLKTFMDSLGLEANHYEKEMKQCRLNMDMIIRRDELLSNESVRKLYSLIYDDVISNSKGEYKILLEYLDQKEFKDKVAVVDIGWNGSMQYFLTKTFNKTEKPLNMEGYYIGLASGIKKYTSEICMNVNGYVFDCYKNENDNDAKNPFVGLFETLFLAQEGSTKKYRVDSISKQIKPILSEYEYGNESNYFSEAQQLRELQLGALDFIKEFNNSECSSLLHITPELAFNDLYQCGVKPSFKALKLFGSFPFFDGEINYLAKPRTIVLYILHPKSFIKDLYFCRWKIGFLRKVLKLPLPYLKIYNLLKKYS